jgi:hypothetical protein
VRLRLPLKGTESHLVALLPPSLSLSHLSLVFSNLLLNSPPMLFLSALIYFTLRKKRSRGYFPVNLESFSGRAAC